MLRHKFHSSCLGHLAEKARGLYEQHGRHPLVMVWVRGEGYMGLPIGDGNPELINFLVRTALQEGADAVALIGEAKLPTNSSPEGSDDEQPHVLLIHYVTRQLGATSIYAAIRAHESGSPLGPWQYLPRRGPQSEDNVTR